MVVLKSETEIIDGIIRIKIGIPFDVKDVAVYIYEIDGQKVMIDAGFNMLAWRKLFIKELDNHKIEVKDIDYCIVTHEHLDHCGLTKFLKRKNHNLKIYMHEITNESLDFGSNLNYKEKMEKNALKAVKEIITYGMEEKEIMSLMRGFLVWPQIVRYQKPTELLKDGDELTFDSTKLKIISTPGHSLGHICVFDSTRRILFSGDHILSRITPHIGIYHISSLINDELDFSNILDYYLKSLDKILELDPRRILPAHQDIINNPRKRIEEIKQHHQTRFNEIRKAIENEPLTPYQISQIHFGTELDGMNKYLALNEVLSHLIYMEQEGKVKRFEKEGKILFLNQ